MTARAILRALVPRPVRHLIGRVQAHPSVIRLVFTLRNPGDALRLAADCRKTRRQFAFLVDAASRETNGRTFVIVGVGLLINWIKMFCFLGAGLRLAGWKGVVILETRDDWIQRIYHSAMGLGDIRYLNDYDIGVDDEEECRRYVDERMAAPLTLRSVREWTFRDAEVGVFVLSTLSRSIYQGAPDLSAPEIRKKIPPLLSRALRLVIVSRRIMADVRPSLCMDLANFYLPSGPVIDAVLKGGGHALRIHQPWNDDALLCKRITDKTRRVHPSSLSPETFEALNRKPWTEAHEAELDREFADRYSGRWEMQRRSQPSNRRLERAALCGELGFDPQKPLVVVFSHVLWDANTFYSEDLFDDFGIWFMETVRAAAANDRVNWILKMHPVDAFKRARERVTGDYPEHAMIRDAIGAMPAHMTLLEPAADISTLSIFEAADYAVTVRGTAGMEASCFGVVTLTVGTGRYTGLGFTVDSDTPAEYLDRLSRLHEIPPMTAETRELARRHAYAVFRLRPWRMKSVRFEFDCGDAGWEYLDQNLVPTVTTLDELKRNGDLDLWVKWAEESTDPDYLSPPGGISGNG